MASSTKASKAPLLSRDDVAPLLIDHQIGLLTGVRDMPFAIQVDQPHGVFTNPP